MRTTWTCWLACGLVGGTLGAAAAPHPLDPLTGEEIEATVAVLRAAGKVEDGSRFAELGLLEPAKAEVLAWSEGKPVARKAVASVLERAPNRRFEGIVDLAAGKLESWRPIDAGQPVILMEEYDLAGAAVRADERWRRAMGRRGITDPEAVYIDVWAPGEAEVKHAGAARVARALTFLKGEQRNPYGVPVEGVVAVVDLNRFAVIELLDTGVVPLARENTDFYDPAVTGARPGLKPLRTTTPEGPGFELAGHAIAWDRWRLRWSMTPREGLVIHQVGWDDGARTRPVLYRAALSEMLVPYGDPSEAWSWRSAFDEGEYGLGRWSNPLERGTTAPPHAVLVDAVFADDVGKPYSIPGAVAVFERDAGILWSHHDSVQGTAARAGRELVIRAITTIGNYDYVQQWVLRQDGGIDYELQLTGSLLLKGTESERCEVCDRRGGKGGEPRGGQRHGTLVAPGLVAPNHQHFVNLRLDLDVDGPLNAVKEMNVRAEKRGRRNPRGNGFYAVPTYLTRERRAGRDASPLEHRTWEVASRTARNPQQHPTAYALHPGAGAVPFLHPETALRRLGAFADHALHVTRYRDGERFAAGPYPSQNRVPGGLAVWTRDDEPLEGEDVVLWYTIGVTHVPRPEEHPIMSTARAGFRLEPVGFFARNPALDVPRGEAPPSGAQGPVESRDPAVRRAAGGPGCEPHGPER